MMKQAAVLFLILFTVAMARDALPDECKVRAQTRVYIEVTALQLDLIETQCAIFEGQIRGRNVADEWWPAALMNWRLRTFHMFGVVPVYDCTSGVCLHSQAAWSDYPLRTWMVADVVKVRMTADGRMKSYWVPVKIYIAPPDYWGNLPEN